MRFIHCADLHLDSSMATNLDADKRQERQNELLVTFLRMIEYAVEEDVDGILICGDLFDGNRISQKAMQTVYQAVVNHPEIIFFYLAGNHDEAGFWQQIPAIPDNLKGFGTHWKYYQMGNVVIAGVELGGDSQHIYEELRLNPETINLVMLHGQEQEYEVTDQAETISLRALRGKGIDYLALGHVHFYKEAVLDSRGMYCYSGCLEGRGFDECGEHGFVLVDIEEQNRKIRREFIPFASRYLYEYLVDVSSCESSVEIIAQIREALKQEACDETSLVKVTLVGQMEVGCEKDVALICKSLESDYYVFKLVDQTEMRFHSEDYAWDATLRGEFVRSVLAREDLGEEEKAKVIHYGMKALAGEVLE